MRTMAVEPYKITMVQTATTRLQYNFYRYYYEQKRPMMESSATIFISMSVYLLPVTVADR